MASTPEIGSEFALGPGTSPGWLEPLPHDATLLRSGRDALRAILNTLRGRGRDRLILGAFQCDAVLQAAEGWTIDPVPVDDRGLPRADALFSVARAVGERGVLLAVPLFGFPWPEALGQVAGMCRALGVEIVEDRTHSLLTTAEPLAPIGFASLRKWFGLPDGGAAWGLPIATPGDADDELAALRLEAMTAKHAYLEFGKGKKAAFLKSLGAAEEFLDGRDGVRAMSWSSRERLAADVPAIRARRRANFGRLWHGLPSSLRPLVPELTDGVVPLGLPVVGPERDALKQHLVRRRIYPAWHWKRPEAIDPNTFPRAASIADSVMTLVCDQRYDAEDMDRTLSALRSFKG